MEITNDRPYLTQNYIYSESESMFQDSSIPIINSENYFSGALAYFRYD